jgi:hypothetical protein
MTLEDDNLNVGINTAAPNAQAKLHVEGSGAEIPYGILATSRTGTVSVNTHGVWADGSWRGVYGTNLSTVSRGRSIGVQGVAGGTNYVVEAVGVWAQATGTGTVGTNNYGLYATASGAAGQNFAAWMNGTIRISDGTQGAGYVLTSDATGIASWQGPVSISAEYLLADLAVPVATDVTINNWSTIANEDGGSNYNPVTGEYTIPVTGYYDINATVNWLNYSTADRARLNIRVNGITITASVETPSASFGSQNVHLGRRLVAGDIVTFVVNHASPNPQTLGALSFGTNFDIHLVHR